MVVAIAAALVFVFDNKTGENAAIWLRVSIGVLVLCFLVWQLLGLGDVGKLRPDKPEE